MYLRGLDGDSALLFILTGVRGAFATSLSSGDDSSLAQQGVGQSSLAVIHMGDHRHVADVAALVHDSAQLLSTEIHLRIEKKQISRSEEFNFGEPSPKAQH